MTPASVSQPHLRLTSPAFAPGGELPVRHTCDGENLSPAIAWSGVPETASSLALFVYDRDAGQDRGASVSQGFVHWLVYNIPVTSTGLPEGVPNAQVDMGQGLQARNDFAPSKGGRFPGGSAIRGMGYEGPCPPARHRYVFDLMVVDVTLNLPGGASPSDVLKALQGHVVAEARLEAWYESSR
jgi:Raf kinase inhibitor-like YbhB/YbcL family protein